MERAAIQELFDYTGWAWERFARVIDGLEPGAYARPVPGSGWPSIAACLTHFVASYDGWLNMEWGGIEIGAMSYPAEYPEPVNDWEQMRAYYRRVRTSFESALALPDDRLSPKKRYEMDDVAEDMSPADILANLVIHERGHHGDLNTLFHQLNIRSFIVDFRYFKTRRADFVMDEG